MKIGSINGAVSVNQVTVRVHDYITNTSIAERGIMFGAGINSQDFSFNFNTIQELDEFLSILVEARKRISVKDDKTVL